LQTKDSLDIYVKELGIGKDTVIIVHGGFGANHYYMLDAIKGLENKYHFILYDQRGSLLSPAPLEKLTFQKNVDDLFLLIKQLKLKKVKIMSHSMGTLVSMEFLKQHPEMVSNLVLIGCIPTKSDSISSVFSNRVNEQMTYLSERKELKDLIKPYQERENTLSDKEKTEYWRIQFASGNIYKIENYNLLKGGRAFYNQNAAIMGQTLNWQYDYRPVLNANGKVTIIQGDYDFLDFNADNHKKLLTDYPKVQIKVIKNAGHNIWIDDPVLFKNNLVIALDRK